MAPAPRRSSFPGLDRLAAETAARRRRLIGELATARRESELSQTEVAARMGTSQSAVARLESGDTDVRLSTLERYAAALGRTVEWQAGPTQEQP